MASGSASRRLDVYGLTIAVGGDWPEAVERVRRDWAWFETSPADAAEIDVSILRRPPDLRAFGPLEASFVTPRNVVYHDGPRTIVDYFGRAVTCVGPNGRARVEGEDEDLVREAVWQFLVSRIGAHVESLGRPRLHALGLAGAHGGVAILLGSGGGKTQLALQALADERVRLLSDDMPLIDRAGFLHPFPLGISVNVTDAAKLAGADALRYERMEFHPRVLLPVESFAHRIERWPQPLRHLVVAQRSLRSDAELRPLPRWAALGPLVRQGVVGIDLYQGVEFLLRRGMRDAVSNLGVARTRAASCAAALRGATVWRLVLGLDDERNWAALGPLLV